MPGDGAGLPPTLGGPFRIEIAGGRFSCGWLATPAIPFDEKGGWDTARAPPKRSGAWPLVARNMLPRSKLGWIVARSVAGARAKLPPRKPPVPWEPARADEDSSNERVPATTVERASVDLDVRNMTVLL